MNKRSFLRIAASLAAVLALMLCAGAAMAESEDGMSATFDIIHPDWLTVNQPLSIDIGEVPGASRYLLYVMRIAGSSYIDTYNENMAQSGSVEIPASCFTEPGIYSLGAQALNSRGEPLDYYYGFLTVLASEPTSGAITLTTNGLDSTISDSHLVTACAPGAESLTLYCDFDDASIINGTDYATLRLNTKDMGTSGTFHIYAEAAYPNGDVVTSETLEMNVVCYGELGDFNLDFPITVEDGQPLTFTLYPVSNAAEVDANISYSVRINDVNSDIDLFYQSFTGEEIGSGKQITFSGPELTLGTTYIVHADAWAPGWLSSEENRSFTVVGTRDANVELRVEDELRTDYMVPIDSQFEVSIDAPVATIVRVWFNGNFHYIEERDPDSNTWTTYISTEDCDFHPQPLFAQIYTGYLDPDEEFSEDDFDQLSWDDAYSNIVNVTVTSDGDVDQAEYEVPATVERGQLLKIKLTKPSSNAEWYEGNAWSFDNESYGWFHLSGGDMLYMATAYLEPGEYHLDLKAHAPGLTPAEYEATFEVLESPTDRIVYELSATETTFDQPIIVSAYRDGASYMKLLAVDGQEEEVLSYFDGESLDYKIELYSETMTVYIAAYDEDGDVLDTTDRITLHRIEVDVDPLMISIDAPGILKKGVDLEFTVNGVEDALDVEVDVEGCDIEFFRSPSGDNPYTVAGDGFEAGHYYLIYVRARDANGDIQSREQAFYVYDGALNDQITITVNGESHAEVLVREDYTVTYSAPAAKALLLSDGGNWYLSGFNGETDDIYTMGASSRSSDHVTYLAKAYYGDLSIDEISALSEQALLALEWSETCAPATVDVISYGKIGDVSMELGTRSVARGELLPVTVTEAQGATYLHFSRPKRLASGYGWNMLEGPEYTNVTFPFTAYLPTADLEPGGVYAVSVWAGAYGYDENGIEIGDGDYYFEVTEPEEGIQFNVTATEATPDDRVYASIFAPGADEVRLTYWNNANPDIVYEESEDGVALMRYLYELDLSGTYTLKAEARYGEEWAECADRLTLNYVNDSYLAAPEVDYLDVVRYGEMFMCNILPVDGAETYHLYVWDITTGDDIGYAEFNSAGTKALTPNYLIDGRSLEPGHIYGAYVAACANGKEDGTGADHYFAVIDNSKVLYLPNDLERIEESAFEGVDAQMIVVPEGVTYIGDYAFDSPSVIAIEFTGHVDYISPSAFPNKDYLVVIGG